eukprot:EG_transcript_10558
MEARNYQTGPLAHDVALPVARSRWASRPAAFVGPSVKLLVAALVGVLVRGTLSTVHRPELKPFVAVQGYFVQEGGAEGLPRTPDGIVENLGARVAWSALHGSLGERRKLILLLRHAEGYHNWAQEVLGRQAWFKQISTGCTWETESDMFDSQLTPAGLEQARALNVALRQGELMHFLSPNLDDLRVLTSPLTRTMHTVLEVLKGIPVGRITATELCRESIGLYPCDARRSVSGAQDTSPCPFKDGLQQTFHRTVDLPITHANLSHPIRPEQYEEYLRHGAPLGLVSDADPWWVPGLRETYQERAVRARLLLASIFDHVSQPVVLVATHAGFIRDATRDLGLEPYLANNCEIVPVVVEDRRPAVS